MAQVVRLVKRDQQEIQEWIDSMLVKVEKTLGRVCQMTALLSLFSLVRGYHPVAEIACAIFILLLIAYHDRKRIAKFLALNFTRKEILILQVSEQ